jgi:lipoate-protein ligase A
MRPAPRLNDPTRWRLLVDAGANGAWNMAVDEAILDRYAGPQAPDEPTLRLYGFRPAALSLGRLQEAATSHCPDYLRESGIDLVRRPTGGNAVLHDQERTYSVIGRLRHPPFDGRVLETYRRIAACLVVALQRLDVDAAVGPGRPRETRERRRSEAACFALLSSHEITHAGRKLVGSAQLRRRGAFLQHGSIPLRSDAGELARSLGAPVAPESFTDLESAAGARVAADQLDTALVTAFEETLGASLNRATLSAGEMNRATRLYSWKYRSTAWTYEGRVGTREQARGPL